MINIPKGTKDVLPQESYKWHYIESKVKKVSLDFNIKEIRTPTFEHTELFNRSVGETTDVVQKEMYTFDTKGGTSITLRPEGTAGAARAMLENAVYNIEGSRSTCFEFAVNCSIFFGADITLKEAILNRHSFSVYNVH